MFSFVTKLLGYFKMKNDKDIVLTRAEEDVMHILWKIKKGVVKDFLEYFPNPKPAYNTVSTIVRILESKGFIGHKAYGKTHEYFPLISKDEYTSSYFRNFLQKHFNNSFQKMGSFFAKSDDLDMKDLEETLKIMQQEVENQKQKKS